MSPQQAENLRILIRHMENVCTRTLDMGVWANGCGTPACALGEACVAPTLKFLNLPEPRNVSGLRDALNFVDIHSGRDFVRLFASRSANAWGRNDVTPKEWATEARKVLAEHGYSMDDFPAFMAKVLQPVDLEQAI